MTAKGDDRRQAILDALRDLLRDRPLADISVRALTERAGVTRSGFYFYFPSTAAAVVALLEDLREHVFTLAQAFYAGGPGTPEERLRAGMTNSVASWRRNPVWTAALLDADALDTDYVDGYVQRVGERIAIDAPDHPAPDALALGLVSMLFALMERDVRAIQAAGEPLPGVVDTLVHVWHAAIYG